MCWGATLPKLLPSSSIVTQVQSQECDALRDLKAAPGNRRPSLRSPAVFGGRRLRRRPSEDGAAKTPSPGLRAAWKPGRPRRTKTEPKTKVLRRWSHQGPFARTLRRAPADSPRALAGSPCAPADSPRGLDFSFGPLGLYKYPPPVAGPGGSTLVNPTLGSI